MAAPEVQVAFGLTPGMAAGWTLAAVQLLSAVLEPPLLLWADRHPRRPFVCGGLAALALACLAAAVAPAFPVLLLALLVCGPASGCGVGLAQAALVEAEPEAAERALARWTLLGAVGDLAAPALLAALALAGLGWRWALGVSGALLLALAAGLFPLLRPSAPPAGGDGAPGPGLLASAREALADRELLLWSFGCLLCGLLDEIAIAFGSLWLRDHLGLAAAQRSIVLGAFVAGSIAGLAVAGRALARLEPLRLLQVSGAVALAGWAAFLAAPTPVLAAAALLVTGAAAALHYPLLKAQAYRRMPGRAGAVIAVGSLFVPADVALPVALGAIADGAGLGAAMAALALQPLGVLALASLVRARRRAPGT